MKGAAAAKVDVECSGDSSFLCCNSELFPFSTNPLCQIYSYRTRQSNPGGGKEEESMAVKFCNTSKTRFKDHSTRIKNKKKVVGESSRAEKV